MDLYAAYELCEEFTLHDASYLLDGYEPLPPGVSPKNDPHERIRHRAGMLAHQLVNDAKTGKLRATHKDYGGVFLLGGSWEWTVKRNDLKDWAKRKMIRPAFLFPQLPHHDSVRNVATAEANRFGTQHQVSTLEHWSALLRIAQQINNGQLLAYVRDSDGAFARLRGDDALVFQMRDFLSKGAKSEPRLPVAPVNQAVAESTIAEDQVAKNMDWAEQIYIPTEVVQVVEASSKAKNVHLVQSIAGQAKQDGCTRRDILDPVIDKAIRDAGRKDLQQVFLKLRELALQSELPFTGEIDGDALCYTNSENKPDKLNKKALSQRLQRRRAVEGR